MAKHLGNVYQTMTRHRSEKHPRLYASALESATNPIDSTFELFCSILRTAANSNTLPRAYGYMVAGIQLYWGSKSEDYRRHANTAKLLLGAAGAAVSVIPVAAPGAAGAVLIGCALVDHVTENKIDDIDTSMKHLRSKIAGNFLVDNAADEQQFHSSFDTASLGGKSYV